MAKRFFNYSTSRYRLEQLLEEFDDGRKNPTYKLKGLFSKLIAGILIRKRSLIR